MKRHATVDEFIENADLWQDELIRLREILNSTELEETVKWGGPVYVCDGKNVVGMGSFKSYFGLWFYQGALLEDKNEVLINSQEGKTKALRQWRMTSKKEIKPRIIKAYVKESIAIQREGKEIKPDRAKPVVIPPLLKKALSQTKADTAFKALTKGRQREYADYVADAKREQTKLSRIDKIIPMILAGVGLHDKYRDC